MCLERLLKLTSFSFLLSYYFLPSSLETKINIRDLGLNELEKSVFRELIGPRFQPGSGQVRLTAEKFPNRIENKKYVTHLLEQLIAEAKRVASIAHEYDEPAPAQ